MAMRRAAFERSGVDNTNAAVDLAIKRKAAFDEDAVDGDQNSMYLNHNGGLLPEDGFTWIGQEEQRGKRVKLDKDTIVKKRVEYFKVHHYLVLF